VRLGATPSHVPGVSIATRISAHSDSGGMTIHLHMTAYTNVLSGLCPDIYHEVAQTRPDRTNDPSTSEETEEGAREGAESAAVKPTEAAAETIVVKRARATHSRSAPPIQCLTCKKTDVPLILGGSE